VESQIERIQSLTYKTKTFSNYNKKIRDGRKFHEKAHLGKKIFFMAFLTFNE